MGQTVSAIWRCPGGLLRHMDCSSGDAADRYGRRRKTRGERRALCCRDCAPPEPDRFPAPVESLAPLDQLVLTAIYLLHGEGYSVNITEKISDMSGARVLLGATFMSLSRLESLGLVSSRL